MSEKVKVDILRLEIGYQSKSSDTHCNEEPHNQRRLKEILGDTVWDDFIAARQAFVDPEDLPQDQWVAPWIEQEINDALGESAKEYHVRVLPDDLRLLGPKPALVPPAPTQASGESLKTNLSGYDGTICKKVGKIWENARSYELHFALEPQGNRRRAWPGGLKPEDSVMYATLVWQCWPKNQGGGSASGGSAGG
jgi:hypothetical protein